MEYINQILTLLSSVELKEWVAAITGVVTAATAITALTPTKTDNNILNGILAALNFVAGNVLMNKNADDK